MQKNIILILLLCLMTNFVQASDITPGGTYQITSYHTGKRALSIKDSSFDKGAKAVSWVNTEVNSQRWLITADEDGCYNLTNAYTDMLLRIASAKDGAEVSQNTTSTGNLIKWNITPVDGYENGYHITTYSKVNNEPLYMEINSANTNGEAVVVALPDPTNTQQIWKIEQVENTPNALSVTIQDEIMQAWKTKFYKRQSTGYDLTGAGFWGQAENMEVVLDAYETTGNEEYKTMFDNLYKYFVSRHSTSWMGNEYNDDVAWASIACVRAYLMFGTKTYLTVAKTNFDNMYARALITEGDQVGALQWKVGTGSLSCINGPAQVAACYLAIATGDNTYYEKAKNIHEAQRRLMVNSTNGQVYDGPGNTWASTYNQGTYLGACLMLYNYYGTEEYKQDAIKVANYSRQNLTNDYEIINVCGSGADLPGFKGILMRYIRRFIVDLQYPDYAEWLKKNAVHAYNNRNSYGVIWTAWWEKSGEDQSDSFGCGTAVSAALNSPMHAIVRNAFDKIEAESFDYIKGVYVQSIPENKGQMISNIKDGFYTGYNNVNFGFNVAKAIEINIANESTEGAKIEIRQGGVAGTLLGEVSIPATGSAATFATVNCNITPTSGIQNIYLVYTGGSGTLFNIDYFRFTSDSYTYIDVTDYEGSLTSSANVDNIENLIDNNLQTAVSIDMANDAVWFQYQAPVAVNVKAYAVGSSQDAPESDPKAWKFQASNDGTTWKDLDTKENQSFERLVNKTFEVTTTESYQYFRLYVTEKAGSSSKLQIGDWQIYGNCIYDEHIKSFGGELSAQYPATMYNAFDQLVSSVYTVTGKSDFWLQYQSSISFKAGYYSITSSDKNPQNDPKSWILQASNDGAAWTTIDQQDGQVFPFRNVTQTYTCAANEGYQYYRLHVTANNGGNDTEIAEWQVNGGVYFGKFYNDLTMNGGTITTSDGGESWALIDNNGMTYHTLSNENKDGWIQYESSIPAKLKGYSITFAGTEEMYPKAWKLEGSNNGTTWTALDSRRNIKADRKYDRKDYSVSKDAYKYFRLSITEMNGEEATKVQISEFEIYATAITSESLTQNGGTMNGEYPGFNDSESYLMLNDNKEDTKYCNDFPGSIWVTYQSPTPVKPTSYSITSANDSPGRDPKQWTLEASNDGNDWTTIDSRDEESFLYRYVTQFYSCDTQSGSYTHFRLNITANNGDGLLQYAEWQLLDIAGAGVKNPEVELPEYAVNVYPNPAADYFNIDAPTNSELSVYSISGKLVFTQSIPEGVSNININNLDNGVYIVKIVSGDNAVSKRLIKR